MTFPIAALTIGAIFIYTAFKDKTIGELLRGEANDSENVRFFGGTGNSTLASFMPSKTSGGVVAPSQIKRARGTRKWENGNVVIAAWIYYELKRIGFTGQLTSGYRTPAYSRSLCQRMCGADSCPGTCAGEKSNHSGKVFPEGAIDVAASSLGEMKAKTKKHHSILKNDLPADPIHFSASGH